MAVLIPELFKEAIPAEVEYSGGTGELRDGELGRFENVSIVLSPAHELEPCKPVFDDRYTGKCKKFRREERGGRR